MGMSSAGGFWSSHSRGLILYYYLSSKGIIPSLQKELNDFFKQLDPHTKIIVGLGTRAPKLLTEEELLALIQPTIPENVRQEKLIQPLKERVENHNQSIIKTNEACRNHAIRERLNEIIETVPPNSEEYTFRLACLEYVAQKQAEGFEILLVNELVPYKSSLKYTYAYAYQFKAQLLFFLGDWDGALENLEAMIDYMYSSLESSNKEFLKIIAPYAEYGWLPLIIRGQELIGGEKGFIERFPQIDIRLVEQGSLREVIPTTEIIVTRRVAGQLSEPLETLLLKYLLFELLEGKINPKLRLSATEVHRLIRTILRPPQFNYDRLQELNMKLKLKWPILDENIIYESLYSLVPEEQRNHFIRPATTYLK